VNIPSDQVPSLTVQSPDYQLNVPADVATFPPGLESGHKRLSWDLLASLGLWVLSVVAIFIIPAIVAIPYIMIRYWGVANAAQSLATDHTVLLLTVIGVIPAHAFTFLAAWAVVTQRGRRPFWQTLRWNFSPKFGFWTAVGVAIMLYLAGAILAKLIGGGPTDIDILANSTLVVRILLAVLATATGPLVEEIVYRGILYPALQERIGMAWSVAIVSFLFALVHVYQYRNSWGVISVIALLSISLTLVRALTGRLLPCFIIHMLFNGIVSVLIVFQPFFEHLEKGAAPKTGVVILWRMMQLFT